MEDFYDLLEVSEDASTDEIDRAWRQKVRTYHPDVNDDTRANAQFKTLKTAHEVLSDETKRAAYDRMGHAKYVRKRLDGLPTKMGPGSAGGQRSGRATGTSENTASTDRTAQSDTQRSSSTSTSRSTSGSSRFGRKRRANRDSGRETGNRTTRTSTASGNRSSASRSQSRTSRSTGGRQSSATTGRSGSRTTSSASESARATADATTSAGDASRSFGSPLLYGWFGVLCAAVLYLVGLWQYVDANVAAVANFRSAVTVDPIGALTTAQTLTAPGTFVLSTATVDVPLTLLLPVGVGALALVLTAVVLSFGRGTAYLYLLGSLAPLAGLGVGPVVTVPDGAVLALLVVLPIGASVVFLADVGRVLFAGQ